ncbi:S-adenosyl-L-methionine-dependent methyltransferase [Schizophyllum fasciatum]
MAAPPSRLRTLVDTISQAVTALEDAFAAAKQPYPSLNAPFNPTSPGEVLFHQAEVAEAVDAILFASSALSASVGAPQLRTVRTALGFTASAAMRVAIDGCVAEILREHPHGLHYKDIAERNGLEPGKLARILRKLASVHIFSEVSPDVFANNRLSSVLDTEKSVLELQTECAISFFRSEGIASFVHHLTDTLFKGAAFLSEDLADPEYGKEDIGEKAPVPYAFKTPLSLYDWFEQPGNEKRLACFSAAMRAQTVALQTSDVILQGFDFASLPPGSKIVDVAGGIGHVAMSIAKRHPKLHFVIEERPAVLEKAKKFWDEELPEACLEFIPQDFFEPQVVKDARVFLLFHIMHNWGKTRAVQILRNLREVASPETKLIIGDQIVPHASSQQLAVGRGANVKGTESILSRISPALAPGRAEHGASLDMIMLIGLNGEERTFSGFVDLVEAGGWSIIEVHHSPGAFDSHIVAKPA